MLPILFVLLPFIQSCFFGVAQRPKTLGYGNYSGSIYVAFQTIPDPDLRRQLEKQGYTILPSGGFELGYGVMDMLDVGFHVSGAGIGPFMKIATFKRRYRGIEHEFNITPYILYDFFITQSIALRGNAVYSWKFNRYFEPYVFYQFYWNPYLEELTGFKFLGNVGNGYYHFYGGGININVFFSKRRKKPDVNVSAEIGFTFVELQQARIVPVFNLGIGVGGATLLECFDERGERKFCIWDILLLPFYERD